MSLGSGTRLEHYEILAPLGAGGMGEVYRAKDLRLARDVAIKVLPEDLANDPHALSRFEREAKAVAALSHPNILAIHDFATDHGISFAVTELLEGETLRSRIDVSPLPWRKAVEIAIAVADGLSAAHSKGIVHRDLKPENIFLTLDGRVKILDFGLARLQEGTPEKEETSAPTAPASTEPGTVLGTFGYMSPEQVRGQSADACSDVFSFGCVLYEMIAGRRAFSGTSAIEKMSSILRDDPRPLSNADLKAPPELDRVVSHCLEKNPEQRFQSARDLAFALKTLLTDSTASRVSPVSGERAVDSVAVLPFLNAGSDPDTEYLSDGITESIINTLSQLPRLRVVARSTVFRYKGREADAQKVGRELAVRVVLTGRVRQLGKRLVIGTELEDVVDGCQVWGEQYNRELTDIFAVQEEISKEIAEKLRLKLTGEERRRLTKHYTENTEAYQLYLKGRYYWNKRTQAGLRRAIEYFEQAIHKDANYALAHAGLADCYGLIGSAGYGEPPPGEAMTKARMAAARALELDELLAEAHASLAFVQFRWDWDWAQAEKEFQRAIELNPNYASARHWYAFFLAAMGRLEEGVAEMRRARELDPLSLVINTGLGRLRHFARQYDQAIEQYQKTLELDSTFAQARFDLGMAYLQKAMFEEAIAEFQKAITFSGDLPAMVMALGYAYAVWGKRARARQVLHKLQEPSKRRHVSPLYEAFIYAGLGEKDQAFERLQRGYEDRSGLLVYLKVEPMFDSLRADPRFQNLLRCVGLEN